MHTRSAPRPATPTQQQARPVREHAPPTPPQRGTGKKTRRTRQLVVVDVPSRDNVPSPPRSITRAGKENRPCDVDEVSDSEEERVIAKRTPHKAVVVKKENPLPTPTTTPTKKPARAKVEETPEEKCLPTPPSSATKSSPRYTSNIYAHASALLNPSSSIFSSRHMRDMPLLGRDGERAVLIRFLEARFPDSYTPEEIAKLSQDRDEAPVASTSASLYVSGSPGVGKTALLSTVLSDFSDRVGKGVRVHMENASSFGTVGLEDAMWDRLARGLSLFGIHQKAKVTKDDFLRALNSSDARFLLILDEIDHLQSDSRSPDSLLSFLFSLAHSPSSPLTIIGIANSLDLTARFLQTDVDVEPLLLHFEPYKAEDMVKIIKQRLELLSESYPTALDDDDDESRIASSSSTTRATLPVILSPALELCARKVAAVTGDIRTIFQIVRRMIDLKAAELTALASRPSTPTPLPRKSPSSKTSFAEDLLSQYTPATAPKLSPKDALAALKASNLTTPLTLATRLADLSLNARLALVGLVVALNRQTAASSPISLSKMKARGDVISVRETFAYEVYKDVVAKEGTLSPMLPGDFRSVLDHALDSDGFVRVVRSATASSGMWRTSSTGSAGKSQSKAMHHDLSADSAISLPPGVSIDKITKALKETPSSSHVADADQLKRKSGAIEEVLRLSVAILHREEMRLQGKKAVKQTDDFAPRQGFHGKGLTEGRNYIGGQNRQRDEVEDGKPDA